MERTEQPWSRFADARISSQLEAVEQQLHECASQGLVRLPAVHAQLASPRSKRLRPLLLLCAARYGPNPPQSTLIRAAAAIELLHQATLYHDDIVDESPTRRGAPTVQGKHGPVVAAFAGSELLYATVELFADLPPRLRRAVGRTGNQLCLGQLRELETLTDVDLSLGERMRMMRGKTASLFALAARIGAVLAGADEAAVRRLARFGLLFGLCFQLTDDLRDFTLTPPELGRAPGADLKDGVYTLPILFALRHPGGQAEALRDCLRRLCLQRDETSLQQAMGLVSSLGGIASSVRVLREWIGQARTLANRLQPQPGSARLLERLLDPFEREAARHRSTDSPFAGLASIGFLEGLRV